MKKVFYATLALGALVIASCQKENSVELPKVDSPVFTAHIDAGTKTVLNGQQSEWNEDHIWVLNGDPSNNSWKKEYATTATSGAAATFTEVNSEVSLTSGPVVAICPTSAGKYANWNTDSPEVVTSLTLPATQTATDGSYDPAAHIAVAYSENTSLSFKNAVSLLKFTVGSDNVSEVCIYAHTSTDILSGNFDVIVKGENAGTISTSTGNNYVKATGTFEKGKTYYIACLPTTFTKGFTVEVVSNGVRGRSKTTTKGYTLKRNTILDLGTIETMTVYLTPGAWTSAGAVLSVYCWELGDYWDDFSDADGDGLYEAKIPIGVTRCSYIRSNPEYPHEWGDNKDWTKYENIDLTQHNYLIVTNDWQYTPSRYQH